LFGIDASKANTCFLARLEAAMAVCVTYSLEMTPGTLKNKAALYPDLP
jgi:hypothetical protein